MLYCWVCTKKYWRIFTHKISLEIFPFIFMNHEQPSTRAEEMMREIDEFLETMKQRLQALDEQEARYEKRRKPLPDKIYHVTT